MLRVPLSLAVLLSALLATTTAAAAAETWEPADKQAFGTAHDLRSKVWFTLGSTGMDEAYWPRIDRPAVRSLDLKVGGEPESAIATGQVTPSDPRSLTPQQVVTARDGAWRITKTYVTDPARDVVLIDVDVRSLNGRPLRLSTDLRAGLDKDRRAETALLARPALREVDGVRSTHVTLALGLGRTRQAAQDAAAASLAQGFAAVSASYAKGWHDYLDSLPPRPAAAAPYAALYDTSLMVLAASEDKTYRGASVASPSMPWAWGQNTIEKPSGVVPPRVVARSLPGGHGPAGRRRPRRGGALAGLPALQPAEARRLLPAELRGRRHGALEGDPDGPGRDADHPRLAARAHGRAHAREGPSRRRVPRRRTARSPSRSAGRTSAAGRRRRSPPRSRGS